MEHYKITIFGKLDDLDAFDEILFELQNEIEPEDRARAFEKLLQENEGEPSFIRHSRRGSPFGDLKTHLKAANLGWQEMAADDDNRYYQAFVATPGDYEEITIDLINGEPAIELSVLQRAREQGPEALDKLISTVEKASRYGEDLILTLGDNLVERYIAW
ncbi:hypothetical protein [Rhizobium sp. MHM7A]|uniref:hypothetical protein n=1 Tax=Rhizobium sp. MHM7A TaxID=2583233 RepID=UPI001106CA6E|nr:hypothetical protein [Rhizobium sp. MHM7A]TLX16120.1 hypothetical protein FFR93_02005 [Rhizobium sp. MHM7A]